MQINKQLTYLFLKLNAIVLLVINQKQAALTKFDQMILLKPMDSYALASRAHLLAQLGDKSAAILGLEQLAHAHPENAAAWFSIDMCPWAHF